MQSLADYLAAGDRKIDRWFEQHDFAMADFSDKPETFENINTHEDVQSALSQLRRPLNMKIKSDVPVLGFAAYSGTGQNDLISELNTLAKTNRA